MEIDRESLRRAALGFAAVSEVVAYTATGYFVGSFLDGKLHSDFWLTVLLTMIGLVGGFFRLYGAIKAADKAKEK